MGTTYRFIDAPGATSEVLDWFRALAMPPEEVPRDKGATLYFRECGPLGYRDGRIDPKSSPLATVILPEVRRGSIWTVGEVHFLATPLRQHFVADDDNEYRVDDLCKALRLRGVECDEA